MATNVNRFVSQATPIGRYLREVVNPYVTFIGRAKNRNAAKSDPVWQIIRQLTVGGELDEYPAGSGEFEHVWDDRESLFPDPPYLNEYSLNFSNLNKRIDVADNASLDFTRLSPWSWGFWFNTQEGAAFIWINKHVTQRGYKIEKRANETIEVEFRASGTGDRIRVGTTAAPAGIIDGSWHFLCVTYDGSGAAAGVNIYFDGVTQPLTVFNDTLVGDPSNAGVLSIGSATGGGSNYDGLLDEVCLWNVELDQDNVTALYNLGIPVDPTQDSGDYTNSGNLVSYWAFTETDRLNLPTIEDQVGVNNGTAVNIVAGNFFTEVPNG